MHVNLLLALGFGFSSILVSLYLILLFILINIPFGLNLFFDSHLLSF